MIAKDAYDRYIEDISRYPRITPDREAELSAIIMRGRNRKKVDAAAQELVEANLRLVVYCLKYFERFLSISSVLITKMDLIAEGNIALMDAARLFKSTHGKPNAKGKPSRIRFSSYACKCIKSRMIRALRHGRFIRIPEHHFSYRREINALRAEFAEDASDEMLQRRLNMTDRALSLIKHGERTTTCMLEDLGHEDEGTSWSDFIANPSVESPADEADRSVLREFLFQQLSKLPRRTQEILMLLFFSERRATLREVAGRYGISIERCRQISARGLSLLRRRIKWQWSRVDPRFAMKSPASAA